MSVLVQYLKFLKSSPGENEKKEKKAELPGYAPSVAGSIDNEKKDEDKLTSSITDHGLASQETPKNINASSAEPVAMRSSSSAAAPAFTQPVANPGRGYNTGVPRPQTQQQPTKIPRVLERIPMANSVNDPRSGTLLDKQGSLGYSRNTGISDVEGEIYVNGSDVELLGKLGFEYSCEEYLGLEKTSEVLDVYSYIEKVAGVPKEVAKLIDAGQAFSGEYLKDMGYSVPKGYEVKGDLVCPIEKKASKERVRVVLPYENQYLLEKLMNPKWPDNYGKRRFPGGGIDGSETPAQAASREFMEELGINTSPDKFEYMGLDPTSGNHYLKLMEHGLAPGKYKASVGSDPYIYLEQGLPEGLDYLGADISKFAPVEKTEQSFQQTGKEKKESSEKTANAQHKLEAVVIKGNPKYLNNPHADKFYQNVANHLKGHGYNVSFDNGEPYTSPKAADLWVGHSRGVDRLRFAPKHTKTIALGGVGGITHSKDKALSKDGPIPDKWHFTLSGDMKSKIDNVIGKTKTAAADPAQTILITGHSGSGKTTLSRQLAEKLKLPVYRVDAQQSWDDLREHFGKNPELERKALIPGSAENKKYVKDIRKIVHKSLKEINGPAILEGTQLTTLPAKQLEKYRASIVVGGDMSQSIAQRLQRAADKAAAKGITFSPEQLAKKREESQLVADSWHPGIEKFKKLPGVINYNHTEHQMKPLVKKLQGLMGKQASEKPGLWANIRAKRARGEKTAKPGDEDYPDKEQWNKLSKAAGAATSPGSWTTPTGSWHRSEDSLVNPKGKVMNNTPNSRPMVESPYLDISGDVALNTAETLVQRLAKKFNPLNKNKLNIGLRNGYLANKYLTRASKAVPAIGATLGASEAHNRWQQEDTTGAAIKGLGVAGDIAQMSHDPRAKVIGLGASWGSTAANAARDISRYNNRPVEFRNTPPSIPQPSAPQPVPIQQPLQSLAKQSSADHPVTSSNIKAVGHDKKERVLDVAFHSGSEYTYKNVPRSLYDRLLKAKSPGKFFNKHIKKDKPFEYEKVAGMPEHIRRAIATGDKALLQAAQSRSVASRAANIAAKKRKLEIAKLLGAKEPKLLQRGEEFQKHFPFSVSHEFEQAKKIVDPLYRPDLSKYLGKPKV